MVQSVYTHQVIEEGGSQNKSKTVTVTPFHLHKKGNVGRHRGIYYKVTRTTALLLHNTHHPKETRDLNASQVILIVAL